MRLSQIKLAGFKSFVEPTHIPLPGQIVGVVGPNGCGKSNVIDALRWVLGESKASSLRGVSMQDVIFNGSGKRKPVARASVELVFDNSAGKAAGQWSSYAEISIGRVLQRNGDSGYYINGQKVRRRDITDIFLGTGLGARAYAIIEQGMISRIIEAKPEELRIFLEEAAGVSKYRDRRRETSLRLVETRDNLLRVGDILLEMEGRLSHLQVQAEVARHYRELDAARIKNQQLLWLLKKREALALQAEYLKNTDSLHTAREAKLAEQREIESKLETERANHYQLADLMHERQGSLYAANARVVQIEQEIKHAAMQQQRIQQQISNAEQQIGQQQAQHSHTQMTLEEWRNKLEEARENLEVAVMEAESAGAQLPDAEHALKVAREQREKLHHETSQIQQKIRLCETQQSHTQRNLIQGESRLQRLHAEKLPEFDAATLQEAQEAKLMLEREHEAQCDRLTALQAQLPLEREALQTRRATLHQQDLLIARIEAKLQAIAALQHSSCDQSLDLWLQSAGIDRTQELWQALSIESGWEKALESVLKERMSALPATIKLLLANGAPPARLAFYIEADAQAAEQQCELIPLLGLIKCGRKTIWPVLREWLMHVYVANNVEEASNRISSLPEGGCIVTPEGHLIGRHSIQYHAPDTQGLLSRQREIDAMQDELSQHTLLRDELENNCQIAADALRSTEGELPPLRHTTEQMQKRLHDLQMQVQKMQQIQEHGDARRVQITAEAGEIEAMLDLERAALQQLQSTQTTLQAELMACTEHAQVANRAAQAAEDRFQTIQKTVEHAQSIHMEAGFALRSCENKITDLQDSLIATAEAMVVAEQNLLELKSELHYDDSASDALQDALRLRHDAEVELSETRIALENATALLQSLESSRTACERELERLREQSNAYVLKEQEARLHAEQWAEQLHNVDEAALSPMLDTVKISALPGEISRLQRAIDALGAVNLAALEELRSETERKSYLEAQSADLQQAMSTLEEAIRHIDAESRALLMDTYNQVNLHLSELFPVLFAGGEARLVLTGEEILDSGVQVMAQPPGKKNSTIHLLSGGEKALTAIALIFSLFKLNPAPFCLLDEVDAPLDDTNTERLCGLIRKMAQQTQFVFISHNKIAMEMAEQLIGVTMQEKGVSRVVSVDIEAALRMRDESSVTP